LRSPGWARGQFARWQYARFRNRGRAARGPSSERVVAVVAFAAAAFGLVDHLVEVFAAELVTHLAAHLAHPAADALGVLGIEVADAARVRQRIEARVLRFRHREARHEAVGGAAAALRTLRDRALAHPQGQHGKALLTLAAAIFVNRHRSRGSRFTTAAEQAVRLQLSAVSCQLSARRCIRLKAALLNADC